MIRVFLPDGSPFEETDAVMRAIESRLEGDPDLADWTVFVGADAPKFYYNEFESQRAESKGMVVVNTRAHIPFDETRDVVARIDADLHENVPGAFIRANVLKQGYGGGDAIRIYVQGDNLDVLRELADGMRAIVESVPGTAHVYDSFGYDPITLRARVDDARANLLGITHQQIATTLRSALDGVVATTYREDDDEIAIRVELAADQRRSARGCAPSS